MSGLKADFFETYPLNKRCRTANLPRLLTQVEPPAIHMSCEGPRCKNKGQRTFVFKSKLCPDGKGPDGKGTQDLEIFGAPVLVVFTCAECESPRSFLLEFGPEQTVEHEVSNSEYPAGKKKVETRHPEWVRKVGQSPRWELETPREIAKALGDYAQFRRKGVACEGEGFGVGAVAYYRRIVEDLVRAMLDQKEKSLTGEEQARFKVAADAVRADWSGRAAIDLVKDELPETTRPGGHNPISMLYTDLSEGLHVKSEDECVELAGELRQLLDAFFQELQRSRDSRAFADLVHQRHNQRGGRGDGASGTKSTTDG